MKKQTLKYRILDHLAECGMGMLNAFFPKSYARTAFTRSILGLNKECLHAFDSSQKKNISAMLSHLNKAGLVARCGAKKTSTWNISKKGKLRLDGLRQFPIKRSITDYSLPELDGKIRVVSFDVPEKFRRKRNWLREQLIILDFKKLHNSVWIGKRPLPEEFIRDIDEMKLVPYVHIIGIEHQGTIEDI